MAMEQDKSTATYLPLPRETLLAGNPRAFKLALPAFPYIEASLVLTLSVPRSSEFGFRQDNLASII
jgi:hypothetical protein